MSELLFPFPYLVNTKGMLNNGSIFSIPKYCRSNCGTSKCRTFYSTLENKVGKYICPNGFGVEIIKVNDNFVCLTCLNVEHLSRRKDMVKKIINTDFLPRINTSTYNQIIENTINNINLQKDFYEKNLQIEKKENTIKEKSDLINDTLHELRKLNAQLKSDVESFIKEMDNFKWERLETIKRFSQNIFSVTQLLSIRLNTYDFGINPDRFVGFSKQPIQIYKKFNKAVYCLNNSIKINSLRIKLCGESYSSVMAFEIIELLPYLFLDNAIKYSYPNETISVIFKEEISNLIVEIVGLSLMPDSNEIYSLVDRGVRGHNARYIQSQGEGIGLYLSKMICDIHNIRQEIIVDNNIKYRDGYKYSKFKVMLTFFDIISNNIDESYID